MKKIFGIILSFVFTLPLLSLLSKPVYADSATLFPDRFYTISRTGNNGATPTSFGRWDDNNNWTKWLSYWDFSSIPAGSEITGVTFYANQTGWAEGGSTGYVYRVKPANESWTTSATWTTKNGTNAWAGSDGLGTADTDYYSTALGSITNPSGDYSITLNATAFQNVFDNNESLLFTANDNHHAWDASDLNSDTGEYEKLVITYTPPPSITIGTSPATSSVTVGTPFNVDVVVDGGSTAFNAAQATVTVSSNLAITGLHNPSSNACNFQYVETPSTSDPSFAGALFNSSSTNCKVYTLTLTPQSSGTGTITFTDGSVKSFATAEEIMTDVVNGSYTISGATPTPTPTPVPNLTINTYPADTYSSTYLLSGTRDTAITEVFVNGSSTGVTYPTSTTWEVTLNLSLGNNNFTIHGEDANNIPTATQYVTINRHTLGDINGDGVVNLTDASLFAVDWGKTSGLTYQLSDMNGDGVVNLTDFSILAKLEE